MDADEKLLALKKAYADIILGISKEAAVRVMSSEKKSVRYQHELKVAKEEGLQMLLRLKKMMDSQVSEAEAVSLDQRKKIEELEAQLQEAEDIVSDLRQELGEARAELDRVKSGNLQQSNEAGNTHSREIPVENRIYPYQLSTFLSPNETSVASDVPFIENRDLPSIILRGKEPGLYRNGCTQRVSACERKLLDKDLCHSDEPDKVKGKKQEERKKDTSRAPDSEATAPNELEKKLWANIKLGKFQSFLKKRKRAIRRRKTATSNPIAVEHTANSDENPSQEGSKLPVDIAESLTQLGYAKDSDEKSKLVKISGLKTMFMDEQVNEEITPTREVTGFSESLCSPASKMGIQKVDASLDQVSRERVIKYTFQRKRKRQAPSRSEPNGSLEMEKKMRDEQSGDQKLEKPNMSSSMDSSRESRRLAQVARQLISLSEKKWWH